MASELSAPHQPRRRWMQYGLRTLLLLMVPVACVAAWLCSEYRRGQRQYAAIRWVEQQGGIIEHNDTLTQANWRRRTFGNWFPESVRLVSLTIFSGEISPLAELPTIEELHLRSLQMDDELKALLEADSLSTDIPPLDLTPLAGLNDLKFLFLINVPYEDLSPLYELKNLETVSLDSRAIPPQDIAALRVALPQCEIKAPQSSP